MADKLYKNKVEKTLHRISDERKRERSRSLSEGKRYKKEKKSAKRKSRKRSHSASTTSSSSSSDSDSDKRKSAKKMRKRKNRSSSSDISSSGSDDDRSKSRNKNRKRKKKRDKKLKKKKKKEKKSKKHCAVDQNQYGAYGILRESDMFVKQQEFYSWIQEVKNTNPETLSKFETRKMFETFMEDYNTATLPHKKYYDLEKWEAIRQQKHELKALKKARETTFSIVDDEKRHDQLHRGATSNKYAGPSRQELLAMQQELRRRQDEEYKKKAGLA